MPSYDHLYKLVLIGDSNVGKTSIIKRFANGTHVPDVPNTIGVDFTLKMIDIREKKIKLHIWDTSGKVSFLQSVFFVTVVIFTAMRWVYWLFMTKQRLARFRIFPNGYKRSRYMPTTMPK